MTTRAPRPGELAAKAVRAVELTRVRLGLGVQHAPPLVDSFDDVEGAELIAVDLPREPAPAPTSRTVQPTLHPMFTREYSEPGYPLRVATVQGARLATASGLVITPAGELVMETLWDNDHFLREFPRAKSLPAPTRVEGTHASIMSLWCNNYFHWIFNSLPRIAVLKASGVDYDGLIVPENLSRFQRETLELIGVSHDELVPFTGEHLEPDRLIWVAPLAPINEPSAYLLDWVRSTLGPSESDPQRMFYVSRRGGTRNASNEAELLAALEPMGFELLLPETLSFEEQTRTFASAKMLAGPHGSNFVNAIFSRRLSVLEFFQPAHVNWGVYTMLCAAGQDHWNLICEPLQGRGQRKFADMHVPLELVLASVEQMLAEPV